MTEPELQAEAKKLANYIKSLGSSFTILRATPSKHIGAIIADAVLQVGHQWKAQVEKRVVRIETHYPQADTLSGLSSLLNTVGAEELLDWKGKDVQERFGLTIRFFASEIDTVSQLAKWLTSDTNRDRLLTRSQCKDRAGIARIADKTADYYRVLVGLPDAVAIDSRIKEFLRDADVRGRSRYDSAQRIVQLAASMVSSVKNESIRPVDLDLSIWEYQSRHRTLPGQRSENTETQPQLERGARVNASEFRRTNNMTNAPSYSPLPSQGRAMVEAKNNDTWGTVGREIIINRQWTACLVCWGGPLDLSTLQDQAGVKLSHKKGMRPYLWIPVQLWISGRRYQGKLRYDLDRQGACISNHLEGCTSQLGQVMTAAGFAPNASVRLKFVRSDVWVL